MSAGEGHGPPDAAGGPGDERDAPGEVEAGVGLLGHLLLPVAPPAPAGLAPEHVLEIEFGLKGRIAGIDDMDAAGHEARFL